MKTYIFRTTTTMKEYNSKHWWIDGNIIPEKTIQAESVAAALKELPDIAARYTKTTETRRFTFA